MKISCSSSSFFLWKYREIPIFIYLCKSKYFTAEFVWFTEFDWFSGICECRVTDLQGCALWKSNIVSLQGYWSSTTNSIERRSFIDFRYPESLWYFCFWWLLFESACQCSLTGFKTKLLKFVFLYLYFCICIFVFVFLFFCIFILLYLIWVMTDGFT